MKRRPNRAAARLVTAVAPVVRRFAGYSIVSVSGGYEARFEAVALASWSIKPRALGAAPRSGAPPGRRRHDRRLPEPIHSRAGRRSMAMFGELANLGQSVAVRSGLAQQESHA